MAVNDAQVFPGSLISVRTQLSFLSHRLLFSNASEVRGVNMPKRKFATTRLSPTCSPLSHWGGLGRPGLILYADVLTLYLLSRFWGLPIQQQIKI